MQDFFQNRLEEPEAGRKALSEEVLVRQCAPTLAGLKVGNIFSCIGETGPELIREIGALNRRLVPRGIRLIPIRKASRSTLIYVYRPAMLPAYVFKPEAQALLRRCGYIGSSADAYVVQLICRLASSESFPHEIGLFLGYPAEDVKGFIEHHAEDCKCCGCWKVYGDADEAQKTFCKYRKCVQVYCECLRKGVPLEKLAVKTAG